MDRKHELASNHIDSDWIVKLLHLSCIFEKLNGLNLSLQGESMNILVMNRTYSTKRCLINDFSILPELLRALFSWL